MTNQETLQKISELVVTWDGGEHTMFDAVTDEPEIAWQAIVEISSRDLTNEQEALLASGPLESLLVWHGGDFIDRVELRGRSNPRFNHLLGGVWRQEMPKEIWERIESVRCGKW